MLMVFVFIEHQIVNILKISMMLAKKIIGEEDLLFTDKINKINRYGLTQERNILITNQAIYNLKKKGNYYI